MSNANDPADKFTGYRYLMDLDNKNQYAVFFREGQATDVTTYNESGEKITPGEGKVIYAMENDYESKVVDGNLLYDTTLYQIQIGKNNNVTADSIGVTYKTEVTEISTYESKYRVDYVLLPESRQELQKARPEMGGSSFAPRLTREIRGATIKGEDLQSYLTEDETFDVDALKNLPVLTQHPFSTNVAEEKSPQVGSSPRQAFGSAATKNKTPKNPRVSDSSLEAFFKQYCNDLTQQARDGRLDPVIGRDVDTDKALINLTQYKKGSVCFTGPAGTGKTAMFHSVAQRIVSGQNVPEKLQDAIVLEIDFQKVTAGTKYRGQLEERMQILLDGLSEREGTFKGRKIILAIDELHHQLGAGGGSGAAEMGQTLKKILTAKGVSFMGATTSKEYRQYIQPDAALVRRLTPQVIDEPNKADTLTILRGIAPIYQREHNLVNPIPDDLIRYSVDMGARYIPDLFQPDKSITIIDKACAAASFRGSETVEKSDFDRAISQLSKLPEDFLAKSDNERLNGLADRLKAKIKGQDEAIDAVVATLRGARSGLRNPNKPLAKFIFPGWTGTGKTELAKVLAEELFGTQDALIKIDMSEYMEKFNVSKLLGAPPGYVGYDSGTPSLTEPVRQRPYSIVLLDEGEKAHKDVYNVLLPVLNDGKITDNQGNVVMFNNTIIIMTSNLGATEAKAAYNNEGAIGYATSSFNNAADTKTKVGKIFVDAVKKHFSPEFIGRWDDIIPFNQLTRETAKEILTLELNKLNSALSATDRVNLPGAKFVFSKEAEEQLLKQGFSEEYGARPLQGIIEKKLVNPLGEWLSREEVVDSIKATIQKNGAANITINEIGDALNPTIEGAVPAQSPANTNVEKKTGIKPRKMGNG